jgi:cell division protein FtsW (lipid II flippase)
METYNKIMKYFWLGFAIVTFALVTYLCVVDDYKTWIYYYVFTIIALLMYFMKVWMSNRMQKHLQYLEDQKNAKS